jgi:hypothetical protein
VGALEIVEPLIHTNASYNNNNSNRVYYEALGNELAEKYLKQQHGSHPHFDIENDVRILYHTGLNPVFSLLAPESAPLFTWLLDESISKRFAYDYHRQFLRLFKPPSSHWLFKSPEHALFSDSLLECYPHARLIMTHRRLDEVLPSFCRLVLSFLSIYFDEMDVASRDALVQRALRMADAWIKHIVDFRRQSISSHSNSLSIIDIKFDGAAN